MDCRLPAPARRVIFTQGGKEGVGKTAFLAGLVEWFEAHHLPFTLLDLDTENKARGSLSHYFRVRSHATSTTSPAVPVLRILLRWWVC